MINVDKLCIEIDKKMILTDLNHDFSDASFILLTGRNGAGKSTFIKAISGSLPYSGTILINNLTPEEYWAKHRLEASIISDSPFIYEYLTGIEMIKAVIRFKEKKPRKYKEEIKRLISLFGVEDFASILCNQMSLGTRKKFHIISMIVTRPKIVLADEPFSGLDEKSCTILCEVFKNLSDGGSTCLVSSHGASGIKYELFNKVIEIK